MIGTLIALGGAAAVAWWMFGDQQASPPNVPPTPKLADDVQAWLVYCALGKEGAMRVAVTQAAPGLAPGLDPGAIPPGFDALLVLTPGDWILYYVQSGKRVYTTVNHWYVHYTRGECAPEITKGF